jgi:hypothetical protein
MELEVFFTIIQQTYAKLVISFMNRKSSCGYATHFLFLNFESLGPVPIMPIRLIRHFVYFFEKLFFIFTL